MKLALLVAMRRMMLIFSITNLTMNHLAIILQYLNTEKKKYKNLLKNLM